MEGMSWEGCRERDVVGGKQSALKIICVLEDSLRGKGMKFRRSTERGGSHVTFIVAHVTFMMAHVTFIIGYVTSFPPFAFVAFRVTKPLPLQSRLNGIRMNVALIE